MTRARLALAAACAAAIAAPVAATQQATFSSRLEAVRVDVAVTERGRPVPGLTAADFEIFDNGVRQQVALIATEDLPLDLVLALDVSGSVEGERFAHLQETSVAALKTLRAADRAALVTFTQRVRLPVPLTEGAARLAAALEESPTIGKTSMIDAAYVSLAHADSGSGRALVIVLSDGVDTSSWLTAGSVVETARRLDVVLFGISSGAPRRTPLEELADASGGELIRVESTREMSSALTSLVDAFRQRYLLSFVPQGVARAGWHTLDVRATRRGLRVKARAGYFGS
jgi:VWFA-related protein